MHEKEDVIYVNNNSYFQKIVSSIVLISFLSMTVTQTYASTEELVPINSHSRPGSASGKVVQDPDQGGVELREMLTQPPRPNIDRITYNTRKVVPLEIEVNPNHDDSSPQKHPQEEAKATKDDDDSDDDEESEKSKSSKVDPKTRAAAAEAMRSGINAEDIKRIKAAALLTVILGTGLWGLMELWINSVINAVDSTEPGYKFTYETREGAEAIDEIILAQRVNIAIAFSSFFFYRSLKLADRLLPSKAIDEVTRKFSYCAEVPGELAAIGFALFTAASSGFELYTSLINYSRTVAGVTTGFFVPLTMMDFYLRYAELKDSTYDYLFVDNAEHLASLTIPKDKQPQVIKEIHDDAQNREELERFFAGRKEAIYKEPAEQMLKRWREVKDLEAKGSTVKQAKRLLKKENDEFLSPEEQAIVVKELKLIEEERESLKTTKRDTLALDKQAILAAEENKKNKALEFRRTRNKGLSLFISSLIMAGAIYYGFKGSQGNSKSAFKLTVPGGTKNAANEAELAIDITRYKIFRDATAATRSAGLRGSLTDVYIPDFNITKPYNVEELLKWCKPCLEGVIWKSYNVNATTGVGVGTGSMGYDCDGVSFQENDWGFSLPQDKQVNPGTCAAWEYWIDRDYAEYAKIKDENTDDYYSDDGDDSVSIPIAAEGASNFIGGVEAVAGGLLTIKTSSKTVVDILNSFTKNPDEILPGKHNLLMNTAVSLTALTEALIYATPAAIAAWLSTQGSKTPAGVNWWFTASKYASSTLNVFPDFSEIYTRIPLDLMSVYYNTHIPSGVQNMFNGMHAHTPNSIKIPFDYVSSLSVSGVSKLFNYFGLSEQDYIRNQMLKMVNNMAYTAAHGTPGYRVSLIEMFGVRDKAKIRRKAVMA
ncbi:MAG: hypothetical protein K2W94_08730 [Alphaproteobacteria bacterium]|nr:hypothetical protein [Alphaproteobacteria bacterium]